MSSRNGDWHVYRGSGKPRHGFELKSLLPPPPPWRTFHGSPVLPTPVSDERDNKRRIGSAVAHPADVHEVDMVNAALYLRRPLLVTGGPGTGKTSLAYRVARELGLGPVLRWPITSGSKLKQDGLYEYDAIGRVQAAGARSSGAVEESTSIGDYLHLGPLGTALLPYELPRVLLVDELDKSDIDLPNDLLSILEDGEFLIRELARIATRIPRVTVHTADPEGSAEITEGRVLCNAFPLIVFTSNREREFPPAFLRRCLRLEMPAPDVDQLVSMVTAHFQGAEGTDAAALVQAFAHRSEADGGLAIDQLLNSVYLATSGAATADEEAWERLRDALWRRLSAGGTE